MGFEPIRRDNLYEAIVHRFEEMMLSGALAPGERLPPERELAARLRVSRTSVRQALSVLKVKGLIEIRHGDGAYARPARGALVVTDLAGRLGTMRTEVVEPVEVRRLLEPAIARLAAERATPEDVAELERIVGEQRRRLDAGQSFVDEDTEFHRRIAIAANNAMLLAVVDSAWRLLRESREVSLQSIRGGQQSLRGHLEILHAIHNRDGDEAYQAMVAHIEAVSALILSPSPQGEEGSA